jgi:3-dehydroquinate synthase
MQQLKNIGSVYCGTGAWSSLNAYLAENYHSRAFILTDTNTRVHCLPKLLNALSFDKEPHILEISAGEQHKTIATCMKLWNELSRLNADRNSLIINLGGGVVTDLGGFVACTFKRGIDFLNIPTSLLAMVDASIGGKTGVDLGSLKNQVGVIREPSLVLLDVKFLDTLPSDHLRSGLAEMLKHGIIASEDYFDACTNFEINTAESEGLIWESVLIKHKIVTEDPTEKGLRKLLNYGHTLGHAIESYYLDKQPNAPLLHGEAIAIGMILATYISSEQLGFPKESLQKISSGISKIYPKQSFSAEDIAAICKLLIYDKKNSDGRINFVLLKDFSDHEINCEVPNSLILEAFTYYAALR